MRTTNIINNPLILFKKKFRAITRYRDLWKGGKRIIFIHIVDSAHFSPFGRSFP